jgi:hypothetical protein
MYDALLQPKNRVRYLDSIDPEQLRTKEQMFRLLVSQMMLMKEKN